MSLSQGVRLSLVLVVVCLFLLGVPGTVAADTIGSTASSSSQIDGDAPGQDSNLTVASVSTDGDVDSPAPDTPTLELRQELGRLVDRKGVYEAHHEYRMPESIGLLEVTIPDGATVREIEGFVREGDRTFRWDGTNPRPELRYDVPANRSIDQTGPIGGPGRLIYADVGEWAVVEQPRTSHSWGWSGPTQVEFDREVTVDGPGTTGDVLAFLGEHEEIRHQAHDQTFRLIVPERASLAEHPDDLFDSLSHASDTLRVGERDEEVFMIATPTGSIDWGVRGLQTGPADLWTRDIETLDDPNNVWLHEYVHTRQGYTAGSDLRWFTEATATYYAALLTLQQERIEFAEFSEFLAVGSQQQRFKGSVLTEPETWRSNANYRVGALVTGVIDKEIRAATGGSQSFQEIFRELNARDGIVRASDFQELVESTGGPDVARLSLLLTTTTERPTIWAESEHRTLFGDRSAPARITFAHDRTQQLQVSGEYRNRPLSPTEAVVLVPGETLQFEITATNSGDKTGEYAVDLRLNDEVVSSRSGSLAGGESAVLSFEYTAGETGEHRLSVGNANIDVSVRPPAAPTVGELAVNRTTIEQGQAIELAVPVTNEADWPAESTLSFTRNGAEIASETVRLDTGETEQLTATVRLSESGTYVFGLDDASPETVIVTVTETDTVDDGTESVDPDDDGSGFGVLAGIIAVSVLAIGGSRYGQRSR